jgi:CheY-like chemotaxis protein
MLVKPCCVLVDDNPDFMTFLRLCLSRVCPTWEILSFASGLGAFGYLLRNPPDLLITADHLPLLDGLRLTTRVRALDAGVSIVVFSERDIETVALAAGASAFLLKRELTEELIPLLTRLGMPAHAEAVQSA